jgi:hypothetical protein
MSMELFATLKGYSKFEKLPEDNFNLIKDVKDSIVKEVGFEVFSFISKHINIS